MGSWSLSSGRARSRTAPQGTSRSLYFDSVLPEADQLEELSYSELVQNSDSSFSSAAELSILDRAEVTLVGLHSTAVMTGAQQSFASVKKKYEDAFLKCQSHAKKLPLTELDYAEARRILPLLPPLVEAAKPHIPDVSGD